MDNTCGKAEGESVAQNMRGTVVFIECSLRSQNVTPQLSRQDTTSGCPAAYMDLNVVSATTPEKGKRAGLESTAKFPDSCFMEDAGTISGNFSGVNVKYTPTIYSTWPQAELRPKGTHKRGASYRCRVLKSPVTRVFIVKDSVATGRCLEFLLLLVCWSRE